MCREKSGTTLCASAGNQFLNRRLNVVGTDVATKLLQKQIDTKTKMDIKMDIKKIIEPVARHFGTSVSDILSSSRDGKIVTARHVAIYLSRSCFAASLSEATKAFNRPHVTILFAERKVRERMGSDEAFRIEVEKLHRELEGRQENGL